MKKYICQYCKNEFEVPDSQARAREKKAPIKYCSKECSNNAHKTGKEIKCKNCGKLFYTTRNKFCSVNCTNQYYGKRKTKGKYKYHEDNPIVKKYRYMYKRCYDKNDINYRNYGARGIQICQEWLYDRDKFIEWAIQNGYKQGLEIDRINVNANYEPNNCRFVTKLENSRNRRITLKYNYNGEIKTLKEIADENNIEYKILWQRINRDNMKLKEAIRR